MHWQMLKFNTATKVPRKPVFIYGLHVLAIGMLCSVSYFFIGNVTGMGHLGTGAGWQIPTLEKPAPMAGWRYGSNNNNSSMSDLNLFLIIFVNFLLLLIMASHLATVIYWLMLHQNSKIQWKY